MERSFHRRGSIAGAGAPPRDVRREDPDQRSRPSKVPVGKPDVEVGDQVEVSPNHICPTVTLMDELQTARAGYIVDTWKIAARGEV